MPDAIRANGVFYTSLPLIGIYLFVFFGLGAEARKMHRDNIKWLAQLLGWRQHGKEESGDTDTSQSYNSFSSQTKKLSATFKQVFSSNRSRGVTIVPFQIKSDISPGCLEKGVLDIRLTTPDQTNANYPPRHSKHKTLLHPPSPPSDTSIEEGDTEPHNATDFLGSQRASFLPRFSMDSTNDIVETKLHSLPRPQCKPPLPPPSQSTNSVDNTNMEQSHPQLAPLPVPPPAYSSTTFPRARQSWI
ncbi:17601_t:CDS:1 [Acaulospora colombiana]|uniref:17601_t:CDS:1 n=1 Tax=Acaulospora colombiana TaxID=27376 RepID=A0ACA9PNZ1_9GLOM|nr:17601_t:CDS:1 [Acaulospora colombiana]